MDESLKDAQVLRSKRSFSLVDEEELPEALDYGKKVNMRNEAMVTYETLEEKASLKWPQVNQ